MSRQGTPHRLIVISRLDAQAECACGCWSYVRTGAATPGAIEAEYDRHVHGAARIRHNAARRAKQQYGLIG